MGDVSPQKKTKRARWRLLLPILVSSLLIFLPLTIQLVYTYFIQGPHPVAVAGEVDLSSYSKLEFQNTSLVGEVNFYPNAWIASEPEQPAKPIPFKTPGLWVGYPDGKGGRMGRGGYGSYHYLIKGLKPGQAISPVRNIDVPSRIYLNGILCFQVGDVVKSGGNSVCRLDNLFAQSISVPSSGQVEFIMEVGDSRTGGVDHLGLIQPPGDQYPGFATRIFAPFTTGCIFAGAIATAFFVGFSPRKRSAFALVIIILAAGFLYFFSRDSILIGLDVVYVGMVFGALSFAGYALGIIGLLLYGRFTRNPVCNQTEFALLIGQTIFSMLLMIPTWGTRVASIPLVLLFSIPLLMLIQSIVFYAKGRGGLPFIFLCAAFVGYGVDALLFAFDILPQNLIIHPTVFASIVSLGGFATAFVDIYRHSVAKRDKAILQRRYQFATNRSLAYFANEGEIISALQWIGESYESSISAGDQILLHVSTLMRRRLMALRERSISLAEEAELESSIADIVNASQKTSAMFVLDYEHGELPVPPLIFEGVIAEISPKMKENEAIVLSDFLQAIHLDFPKRITVSEAILSSIAERCSLLHQRVDFRPGSIVIYHEARKP